MKPVKRKPTRLKDYDYSRSGAYFITVCVKGRKKLLSEIILNKKSVGDGVLDVPENKLSKYGLIAQKHLSAMMSFYEDIKITKYVIMPNHIHMLVEIVEVNKAKGTSGTPSPTNSRIAQLISTFKRFCNREYGENIWQRLSQDHIIRGKADYEKIWNYIDTNVLRWELDCFYE